MRYIKLKPECEINKERNKRDEGNSYNPQTRGVESKGGELALLYPGEMNEDGSIDVHHDNIGDAQILSGKYKGRWCFLVTCEFTYLSPLEVLAMQVDAR